MITEQEKKLIKEVIGKRSLSAIHKFFTDNNILRQNGKPYSKNHISNVLNCGVSHDHIEDGIARAAAFYKEQAEKRAAAKRELIQRLEMR